MHLLARETRALDEAEPAADLGQTPAELVLLSFTDSDLGAAASAWQAAPDSFPSLRLASLARLRHPMSVDLYLDSVLSQARCVVIRLLGGLEYWRYGAEELGALCRREDIALAMLPGDGRDDPGLRRLSTVGAADLARLDAYLRHGGPANLDGALRLMAHLAGHGPDAAPPANALPPHGEHCLGPGPGPVAAVVFYRSHLLAGDIAPVVALAEALRARGLAPRGLHVGSLKDPETARFVAETLQAWRPAVVLNATGFSARQGDQPSPLDAADAPVLQVVLSGSPRPLWEASARGLSQADLAMQVVLPELDGRLLTTAIAFKAEQTPIPGLQYARTVLHPDADGIALAADRAAGWARLAATPRADRQVAVVLSDYPGAGGQVGHAVGLDTFASLDAMVDMLGREGYDTGVPGQQSSRFPLPQPPPSRGGGLSPLPLREGVGGGDPTHGVGTQLQTASPTPYMTLAEYHAQFQQLPPILRSRIQAAWGDPEDDPTVAADAFTLRHLRLGNLLLAIQPDRGNALDRKASYHDPDLPPRHAYIAFYLWLRAVLRIHALVHLGAHGTLEWLPGKAAALSAGCAPAALLRGLPVIYPFIVNNPGEAAAAKRRLGAVMIGHLTPPLRTAGSHGAGAELERLIDEYAAADGLDRRRTALLRREILDRADSAGLLAEGGISRDLPEDDALARLDAYLCDVKELQIRDGLHVFGHPPPTAQRDALLEALCRASPAVPEHVLRGRLDASPAAEQAALLAALDGRQVAPGPAGAPTRGRADVLPTGRNLFAIDPRAVPTRSALVLAEKAAAELTRRYAQDHGDWPRALVIDLWGSATIRTGGEDLALALVLMGAKPVWDGASNRVTGVEILPLALLDRPRVDVTLRISGLFRDAFAGQVALFDQAVRAIAARDEAADWNPLAAAAAGLHGAALRQATARVYGAAPGNYGTGLEAMLARGAWTDRAELGAEYLAANAHAYGQDLDGALDADGLAARVAEAELLVHSQDHAETDLLDSPEYAAHEGGLAAASASLGGAPALYHLDTAHPERPRARPAAEEVARVVRGRAANPAWLAGMMRHGYRGGAEMARSVDSLHAFAATLPDRLDQPFELLFDATLGDSEVDRFLRAANPDARAGMQARFADAVRRGLWRPRRNSIALLLDATP